MAGSKLATFTFFPQTRLIPTQKISTFPTRDRFARAAAVITGRRRPARAVMVPWKTANRDRRKHSAFAHGAAHDHDQDQIQNRFCCQHRIVSRQAIIDGTHNGHSADADGERRGNKGIDKILISGISGFDLQPLSESFEGTFNIQDLTCYGSNGETDHNQHGAAADNGSLLDGQHFLQCAGNRNEQCTDAAGFCQSSKTASLLLSKDTVSLFVKCCCSGKANPP